MAKRICEVEECGEEIPEGRGSQGGLPICDRCRGAQYYAKKMGAGWGKDRLARLHFWSTRLDYLLPHVGRMVTEAKARVASARKRVERRVH